MNRVLITGAGGYIGSVLVRLMIKNGCNVIAVDRYHFGEDKLPNPSDRLEIIKKDIRVLTVEDFSGVDWVIDLAAMSNDPAGELDPDTTWSINHKGRVRVATLSKQAGVEKYILASTCSVYGFQEGMLTENSPVNPLTTYAESSYLAEQDILPLHTSDFCPIIIRQATVYGLSQRMRFDLAVNGMTKGFFTKGKIPILRDGKQWRPFVHVKDTCKAMLMLLQSESSLVGGQIFNIGSNNQNYQIFNLAEEVARGIGLDFNFDWYGEPDHRSYRVDFSKIKDLIDYNTDYTPGSAAKDIFFEISEGRLDSEDPQTLTLGWYKKLLEDGTKL